MSVSTLRSSSRACDVSMRKSDSGVVMRMSGGCRSIAARSFCGVSPVRTATLQLRAQPGERAAEVPLDVVVERLERRDVKNTQTLPGSGVSRSIAERNAASVFPDPVGAWMRTLLPLAMTGQPFA